MARHFEPGASSFRAFVEKLEADAERGEADARLSERETIPPADLVPSGSSRNLPFPRVIDPEGCIGRSLFSGALA
jgi:hypothetical protein